MAVVAAVAGGGARRGSSSAGGGGRGSWERDHRIESSQSQARVEVDECVRKGLSGAVGFGRGAKCLSSLIGSGVSFVQVKVKGK